MDSNIRALVAVAALVGLSGVAFGAFAAHGVSDPTARELLRTGSQYALFHALAALVAIALFRAARLAPVLFLAGAVLFSGSLYALAFGAPRLVGAITPIGGLLFMAGWLALAWSALRVDKSPPRPL